MISYYLARIASSLVWRKEGKRIAVLDLMFCLFVFVVVVLDERITP